MSLWLRMLCPMNALLVVFSLATDAKDVMQVGFDGAPRAFQPVEQPSNVDELEILARSVNAYADQSVESLLRDDNPSSLTEEEQSSEQAQQAGQAPYYSSGYGTQTAGRYGAAPTYGTAGASVGYAPAGASAGYAPAGASAGYAPAGAYGAAPAYGTYGAAPSGGGDYASSRGATPAAPAYATYGAAPAGATYPGAYPGYGQTTPDYAEMNSPLDAGIELDSDDGVLMSSRRRTEERKNPNFNYSPGKFWKAVGALLEKLKIVQSVK